MYTFGKVPIVHGPPGFVYVLCFEEVVTQHRWTLSHTNVSIKSIYLRIVRGAVDR
jgi:hypothetical protein